MTRMTLAIAAAGLLLAPLTSNVAAQQPDTKDKTIMTFSGAVELPGMRLEPGKYVFRLADTATRNVIQVLAEDESKMLGQWLFVPAQRLEASDETVVTFREQSAAATTPAVQYWYYPGERIGKEFIYPKDQALRIAARTGATVRTEEGPVSAPGQTAAVRPAGPAETSAQTAPSPAPVVVPEADAPAPPAQRVERVETVDQPQAERTTSTVRQEGTLAQNNAARTELPATASPLPLMGLFAALSLAGAAGIRAFRL